jgi:hypothetical protein
MKRQHRRSLCRSAAALTLVSSLTILGASPGRAQQTARSTPSGAAGASTAGREQDGLSLQLRGVALWRVRPDESVVLVPGGVSVTDQTIRIAAPGSPTDVQVLGIIFTGVDTRAQETTVFGPGTVLADGKRGVWTGLQPNETFLQDLPELVRGREFRQDPEGVHRFFQYQDRGHFTAVALCGVARLRGNAGTPLTLESFRVDISTPEQTLLATAALHYTIVASGSRAPSRVNPAPAAKQTPAEIKLVKAEVWEVLPNEEIRAVPGGATLEASSVTVNRVPAGAGSRQLLRVEWQGTAGSGANRTRAGRFQVGMGQPGNSAPRAWWAGDMTFATRFMSDAQNLPMLLQAHHLAPGGQEEGGLIFHREVSPTETRVVGWWDVSALRARVRTPITLVAMGNPNDAFVEQSFSVVAP